MKGAAIPYSQAELDWVAARLAAGAPLYLTVLGNAHPPVLLEVGAAQ